MQRLASASLIISLTACALVDSASIARAQSFQGGLRGAVHDPNGVIPGVDVTLTNDATRVSRSTVSNAAGEYAFVAVEPGTYTLRVALSGFKTFERKGLTVATQQFITMDVTLEVGTIEETITVSGAAPLVETSNASTGQVLEQKTLEALPALNRNIFMVAATVPTVILYGDPYQSRMEDQSNGSSVALGGGMRRGNNYTLDGVSLSDLQNRASAFPTLEGVSDTKVQVHTYDAEMGRTGGGVFNTTAKSGTNVFHGSAFLQDRPNSLATASYFDALAGKPKPSGPFYDYNGESFGGPVVHNKTFFWSAHEGYIPQRQHSGLQQFHGDQLVRQPRGIGGRLRTMERERHRVEAAGSPNDQDGRRLANDRREHVETARRVDGHIQLRQGADASKPARAERTAGQRVRELPARPGVGQSWKCQLGADLYAARCRDQLLGGVRSR